MNILDQKLYIIYAVMAVFELVLLLIALPTLLEKKKKSKHRNV